MHSAFKYVNGGIHMNLTSIGILVVLLINMPLMAKVDRTKGDYFDKYFAKSNQDNQNSEINQWKQYFSTLGYHLYNKQPYAQGNNNQNNEYNRQWNQYPSIAQGYNPYDNQPYDQSNQNHDHQNQWDQYYIALGYNAYFHQLSAQDNQPYGQGYPTNMQSNQSYSQGYGQNYNQPYSQGNQSQQMNSGYNSQSIYFQNPRDVNANKQLEAADWSEQMKVRTESSPYQGVYPPGY